MECVAESVWIEGLNPYERLIVVSSRLCYSVSIKFLVVLSSIRDRNYYLLQRCSDSGPIACCGFTTATFFPES